MTGVLEIIQRMTTRHADIVDQPVNAMGMTTDDRQRRHGFPQAAKLVEDARAE